MRASAPYRQRPRSRDDLWGRRAMPYPITACAPEAPLDGPALSDLDAKLMLVRFVRTARKAARAASQASRNQRALPRCRAPVPGYGTAQLPWFRGILWLWPDRQPDQLDRSRSRKCVTRTGWESRFTEKLERPACAALRVLSTMVNQLECRLRWHQPG